MNDSYGWPHLPQQNLCRVVGATGHLGILTTSMPASAMTASAMTASAMTASAMTASNEPPRTDRPIADEEPEPVAEVFCRVIRTTKPARQQLRGLVQLINGDQHDVAVEAGRDPDRHIAGYV